MYKASSYRETLQSSWNGASQLPWLKAVTDWIAAVAGFESLTPCSTASWGLATSPIEDKPKVSKDCCPSLEPSVQQISMCILRVIESTCRSTHGLKLYNVKGFHGSQKRINIGNTSAFEQIGDFSANLKPPSWNPVNRNMGNNLTPNKSRTQVSSSGYNTALKALRRYQISVGSACILIHRFNNEAFDRKLLCMVMRKRHQFWRHKELQLK